MNSFIEYSIKSGISLSVLYLFYWLLMRNDTHFRLNRAYLLFSIAISLVLPFIHSDKLPATPIKNFLPPLMIYFNDPVTPSELNSTSTSIPAINTLKILFIIYISGMFVVFARLIYQAIYLQAVSRLSDKQRKKGFTIISMSTDMMPFSYFRKIYLPIRKIDNDSMDSIIAHEKSHLMQHHYADLFIIEMLAIFQWFNPVVWLYEKSLKEIHEYLADEAVLSTGENQGKYQAILVNQVLGGPVFVFTNQFNQSLIKKRIVMMNRLKTSKLAQLKALFVVPVIATLLVAFANPRTIAQVTPVGKQITVTGHVTEKATGEDIPGSAVIVKGTTLGTLTDIHGNYTINVPDKDAVLVYSFVGFKTQEIPVGTNTKINVEFEGDALALDFSGGNKLNVRKDDDLKTVQKNDHAGGKEEMYTIVEDNPSYPGGTEALHKFLMTNLKYPETAKKDGIEGTVLVQYVIDHDGKVKQAKVLRGVSPELDQEALRLTNMIKGWKPGRQNGKPIRRVVTMPIKFSLN